MYLAQTVKNLTGESLLPSSSDLTTKYISFLEVVAMQVLQAACVRVCQHQAHTQGSVSQWEVCSQSMSFLLGSTFSLAARGPAAELLLSERAKASCVLLVSFTCGWWIPIVSGTVWCPVSQPVSGPADPSNMEISTYQPFPLFLTASLCCILCTGPVLGAPLCKQISSLK